MATDPPSGSALVSLHTIANRLRGSRNVQILIHRNPDGDCVGSATALAAALTSLGTQATVASPDPLPEYLLAIPGAGSVCTTLRDDVDMLICVDVSDPALLSPLPASAPGYLAGQPSLNIDHHLSNLRYAQENYIDTHAASAAEIVRQVLEALDVEITTEIATSLLYGIVNDTYSFQNSNTTPETLRLAGDLVAAGADLNAITFNLLVARRPAAARLWAEVLPTLSFSDQERVAFLTVTLEAQAKAGADLSDADGLVEFLRSIRGVDLAVLVKQTGPALFRLSLRTTAAIDATVVAGKFGGGGHRRAAGCETQGDAGSIQKQVLLAYATARIAPRA